MNGRKSMAIPPNIFDDEIFKGAVIKMPP